MIAPLTWMDFVSSAVVIWPISLAGALLQTRMLRKGKITRQAWFATLALILQFGSMFSIYGLAQTLYFRGVISLGMEIFIIGLATICSASSALHIRFSIPPKTS